MIDIKVHKNGMALFWSGVAQMLEGGFRPAWGLSHRLPTLTSVFLPAWRVYVGLQTATGHVAVELCVSLLDCYINIIFRTRMISGCCISNNYISVYVDCISVYVTHIYVLFFFALKVLHRICFLQCSCLTVAEWVWSIRRFVVFFLFLMLFCLCLLCECGLNTAQGGAVVTMASLLLWMLTLSAADFCPTN